LAKTLKCAVASVAAVFVGGATAADHAALRILRHEDDGRHRIEQRRKLSRACPLAPFALPQALLAVLPLGDVLDDAKDVVERAIRSQNLFGNLRNRPHRAVGPQHAVGLNPFPPVAFKKCLHRTKDDLAVLRMHEPVHILLVRHHEVLGPQAEERGARGRVFRPSATRVHLGIGRPDPVAEPGQRLRAVEKRLAASQRPLGPVPRRRRGPQQRPGPPEGPADRIDLAKPGRRAVRHFPAREREGGVPQRQNRPGDPIGNDRREQSGHASQQCAAARRDPQPALERRLEIVLWNADHRRPSRRRQAREDRDNRLAFP